MRNDIYGGSSNVIINKSQEISLINFYLNKLSSHILLNNNAHVSQSFVINTIILY